RRHANASVIAIVVVVLLLIGGAVAYFLLNKSDTSYMPNVVGQQLTVATQNLRQDGFSVGTVKSRSSHKAIDTVLATYPKSGAKLKKGDAVTIWVSKGIKTIPETVPDVNGMSLANAIANIKKAKLVWAIQYDPTAPPGVTAIPGVVLQQSPQFGSTVQSGSSVTLYLLASGSKYNLRSVAGETTQAAGAALASQSLTLAQTTTQTCSNTVDKGLVVATNPPAGALVSQNQAITLELSSGPCTVYMPTVTNLTQTQADATLEAPNLSLVPNYTTDLTAVCQPGAAPTVANQTPQPGAAVKFGSTVQLTLCQLPSTTTSSTSTTTTTAPTP
ncbi:MAG TPA: PASTA domain-containing protein, partial [Acidimicrobiales bacterium]